MYRTLSPATHVEDVKREARDLLHAIRKHDAVAFGRFQSYDPLAALQPRLADAQYIIAREYGYSSWRKLTQRLEPPPNGLRYRATSLDSGMSVGRRTLLGFKP